jgi:hypothetical protein
MVFCILHHANWIIGDDFLFLSKSAIGKYGTYAFTEYGRFFPLALWDFNILTIIPHGNTVLAHYIHHAVIFSISAGFLLKLFEDIAEKKKYSYYLSCFFLIVLFLSNGFLWASLELTSSEFTLILLLSAFMLFSFRGKKTQKNSYYIAAFLVACYATYCKEPIFGVFTVISLTNLIFGRLTKKDKIFNNGLLVNALLYLIAYYFVSWRNATVFYGVFPSDGVFAEMIRVIEKLSHSVYMLYPILFLSIIRAYFLVFKKDREHLFADGIIFASVAYAGAIVFCLVRSYSYYFTPCFVLAVPAFFYWSVVYVKKRKFLTILTLSIFSLLMASDFNITKLVFRSYMHRRKNDMTLIKIVCDEIIKNRTVIFWRDYSLQDSKDWTDIKNRFDYYCASFVNHYIDGGANSIKDGNEDISSIKNTCMLLYPLENYKCPKSDENIRWLEKNDFSIIARICGVNILCVKHIQPLKLPFFCRFWPYPVGSDFPVFAGKMNMDLVFCCFGEMKGGGLILESNSPTIKFKVSDNKEDLVVKFTIELIDSTNAVVQVLVNEKN